MSQEVEQLVTFELCKGVIYFVATPAGGTHLQFPRQLVNLHVLRELFDLLSSSASRAVPRL